MIRESNSLTPSLGVTEPACVGEYDESEVCTVEALRVRRRESAERVARAAVQKAVPDMIARPSTGIVRITATGIAYDMPRPGWDEYLGFAGLGVLPSEVSAVVEGRSKSLRIDIGGEHLRVEQFGRGLSLQFEVDGGEDLSIYERHECHPQKIAQQIIERYQQSPAHIALHRLVTSEHNKEPNGAYTNRTSWFEAGEDVLGTLGALDALEMVTAPNLPRVDTDSIATIWQSLAANDTLEAQPLVGYDLHNGTVYSRYDEYSGVTVAAYCDVARGRMAFSFMVDPDHWYAEQADSNSTIETLPFVETLCAAELLGALDSVGLMPNPAYQNKMIQSGQADRFGGIYTQMSREIAKWIGRPDRCRVSNLFVKYDPRTHATGYNDQYQTFESEIIQSQLNSDKTEAEQMLDEQLVQQKLLSIDESDLRLPARLLLRMAKQSLQRDASSDLPELPATAEEVRITDGACFDVAGYYVAAADDHGRLGLRSVQLDGVQMLKKTHGHHTFLLQEAVRLNGVELPKGTLLKRGDDGGWAVQRLTQFCFESEEDQLAMGSEVAKAHYHNTELVQRLGAGAVTLGALARMVK